MIHSILLAGLLCSQAWAGYDDFSTLHQIETETADRIQAKIVDPILGPGKASVFIKLRVEVKQEVERAARFGAGHAGRFKSKPAAIPSQGISASSSTVVHSPISFKGGSGTIVEASGDDDSFKGFGFDVPGCDRDKLAGTGAVPIQEICACPGYAESWLRRDSRQTKGISEERYSSKPVFKRFEVVIIHDKDAPSRALKTVRDAMVDAYSPELTPDNVAFRPVEFWKAGSRKSWLSWVERR
ncbi:MAG: hypothetical protein HZB91_00225 [Elusimicrobia bacterium]|nr:hypothetical protein [Elusimicrobiota bacterium]